MVKNAIDGKFVDEIINKIIFYGDLENEGPMIVSKSEDNRSISIISDTGMKYWNFISSKRIALKYQTVDAMVNAMNHFFDACKKNYQEKIIIACRDIDAFKKDLLTRPKDISEDTLSLLSRGVCDILSKHFLDNTFINDIDHYIDKYSFKNLEPDSNYDVTLTNDSIHVMCIVSLVMKFVYFVLAYSITYSIGDISTSDIMNIVSADFFDMVAAVASTVYSSRMRFSEDFDFETRCINFFIDKEDRTIADNENHIRVKHAMVGRTTSSIYSIVYTEFINLLRRLRVSINYNGEDVDTAVVDRVFKINSMDPRNHEFYLGRDKRRLIYAYEDRLEDFGYSFKRVVKYAELSLRRHTKNQCTAKEAVIVVELSEDANDDQASSYDRKMSNADVLNKKAYEMSNLNKEEFIRNVEKSIRNKDTLYDSLNGMRALGVSINPMNITLMTAFCDAANQMVGNPLRYLSARDLHVYLYYISEHPILEQFRGLKYCVRGARIEGGISSASDNVVAITEYIDSKLRDHPNYIKLYKLVYDACKYTYRSYEVSSGKGYNIDNHLDYRDLIDFIVFVNSGGLDGRV